jgi:hypothetical protein
MKNAIIRILSVALLSACCIWYLSGYRFVTIRWNPTPGVSKYRIEYGESLGRSKIVTGTTTKIFINRRLTNYVRATSIQEVMGTPSTNLIIKP